MNWFRRALLESWAMLMLTVIVAFLGPFGSYLAGDFLTRIYSWSLMLAGTYIVVRPVIMLCRWMETKAHLPRGFVVNSGVVVTAFPLALLWSHNAPEATKLLGSLSGLIPFTLLCSIAVLVVIWWAERTDAHLRYYFSGDQTGFLPEPIMPAVDRPVAQQPVTAVQPPAPHLPGSAPRLRARLGKGFDGEILALESEDHYVRVHGTRQSELILLRLRDAIQEMDGTQGAQTHRSWWVARDAVSGVVANGRNREIRLVNGMRVPVARDSVFRLEQAGFLPASQPGA